MRRRDGHRLRLVTTLSAVCSLGLVGCSGGSTAAAPQQPAQPMARGQVTHSGLLPPSARKFPTSATGWISRNGARLSWTHASGHRHAGALVLTAPTRGAAAQSPAFSVTSGQRYVAAAWVKSAGSAGRIGMTLDFFDATGRRLPRAQTGQIVGTTTSWQRLLNVVGFAPPTASTARVGLRATTGGSKTLVDDVTAQSTTGFAAPLAAPLRTRGNDILDATGHRVMLRGIEVDGLQTIPQLPIRRLLTQVLAARAWGANYVRVPLNPDLLLGPSCVRDAGYLAKIQAMVSAITSHGMLAELDMHIFSLHPCRQRPALVTMPDERGVTFWKRVAAVFKGNPLVAFDLYNEPHDVTARIWRDGGTVSFGKTRYLAVGMQRLYDTVRGTGATNLVFASGTNFATQYPAAAPLVGTNNLIFAVHVYTCPTGLPSHGHRCPQAGPNGIYDPRTIVRRFAVASRHTPIVVDEFGFPSPHDGRFDHNVINYVERHGWDGWCAFTFDGSTAGLFNLVRNVGAIQNPAVNGMSVMTGLLAN